MASETKSIHKPVLLAEAVNLLGLGESRPSGEDESESHCNHVPILQRWQGDSLASTCRGTAPPCPSAKDAKHPKHTEAGAHKVWIDATAGGGGHLGAILERAGPGAKVIAVDRDPRCLADLAGRFGNRIIPIHSNYADLENILRDLGIPAVTGGIIADLGMSSMQLEETGRGFSFMHDGPLDMRMDTTQALTAADLVNKSTESELSDIIYRYGEERFARRIAKSIVRERPIVSTGKLSAIVSACINRYSARHGKRILHPSTRTFQALRIAVNDEIGSLEKFLRGAIKVLAPGARLVVLTFHSLEDRLVKQTFKQAAASCVCPPKQPICTCKKHAELLIITRKPVRPGEDEKLANPRSRSAKLRAVEKLP